MRIGHGIDVHRVSDDPTRALMLGLVEIPGAPGLVGHSDADAVTHALCDALLSAANLGDIGRHFPDTDPNYAGVASLVLLRETLRMVNEQGFHCVSGDITIVAEKPRMAPFIGAMSAALTQEVGTLITINATTAEGLGALGRVEGIAATAVVLLMENS